MPEATYGSAGLELFMEPLAVPEAMHGSAGLELFMELCPLSGVMGLQQQQQ